MEEEELDTSSSSSDSSALQSTTCAPSCISSSRSNAGCSLCCWRAVVGGCCTWFACGMGAWSSSGISLMTSWLKDTADLSVDSFNRLEYA